MVLQDFIQKYKDYDIADSIETAGQILCEFHNCFQGKQVIIYGAGILGKSVYNILEYLNVDVAFLLDKNFKFQSKEFNAPVYAPEYLLTYNIEADTEILLAVNEQIAKEVEEQYERWACPINFVFLSENLQNVLKSAICSQKLSNGKFNPLSCFECGIVDNACEVFYQYGKRCIGKDKLIEAAKIEGLGVIMGQVCTLKCIHCNESLPHFICPGGFEKQEDILSDLQLLTEACGVIGHVELVGGEPFLHPDLENILKGILALDIGVIQIFTNGTVVPSDEACEVMANKRIVVYISNYERVLTDKFKKNRELLQKKLAQYGVIFELGRSKSWMDFSSFDEINESDEEWRKQYESCGMNKCHRLYRGHLYGCPHHYGGTVRGFIEIEDALDIRRFNSAELAVKLKRFRDDPCKACKKCRMPFQAAFVKDAIQMGEEDDDTREKCDP